MMPPAAENDPVHEKLPIKDVPVRVMVDYVQGPLAAWEHGFAPHVREWLTGPDAGRFSLAESLEDADLVLLLESAEYKTHRYIQDLRNTAAFARYPGRCFTINYEDAPAGFLPGLYAALPAEHFDPKRHRSWSYVFRNNAHIAARRAEWQGTPSLLFSFRGSAKSHPIRQKLLDASFPDNVNCRVTSVDRWFNHTDDEKASFIDEMLDSYFCLCPRGVGSGTIRLFEVMAAGRCPVIISDHWVPTTGTDWDTCSVRVRESDILNLPAILSERKNEALRLGANAATEWDRNFAPNTVLGASLNQLVDLQALRPEADWAKDGKAWTTRSFFRQNGWTFEQRAIRALKRKTSKLFSRSST